MPVPTHGPQVAPLAAVSFACEWLPYVRGALMQLLLQATWDTSDPVLLYQAQQWAFDLIAGFSECGGVPPAFSCPFDFQTLLDGDGGFVQVSQAPFVPDIGLYVPLAGWRAQFATAAGNQETGVDIHKVYGAAVVVDNVEMVYNLSQGTYLVGSHIVHTGVQLFNAGALQGQNFIFSDDDASGSFKTLAVAGTFTIDEVRLVVHCGYNPIGTGSDGDCSIAQVNINLPAGGCP